MPSLLNSHSSNHRKLNEAIRGPLGLSGHVLMSLLIGAILCVSYVVNWDGSFNSLVYSCKCALWPIGNREIQDMPRIFIDNTMRKKKGKCDISELEAR